MIAVQSDIVFITQRRSSSFIRVTDGVTSRKERKEQKYER